MSSWTNEQYKINAMGMPPAGPGIMMPPGGPNDWQQNSDNGTGNGGDFIGPIPPEDQDTTMDLTEDDDAVQSNEDTQGQKDRQSGNQRGSFHGGQRESRWGRNRDRDNKDNRGDRNRRPRSPDRNRDRSDRRGNDRRDNRDSRDNRDRSGRNYNRDRPAMPGLEGQDRPNMPGNNMMMPGMMQYGNNMAPMPNMPSMPGMPGMPGMPNPNMPALLPNPPMPGMPNPNMPGLLPNPNMPGMPNPNMPGMPNPNMPGMPNPNMPGMPNPNMMPGMHPNMMGNMMPNMMGNMMDPNIMMAQQQMQMIAQQPIYLNGGVLLTPIPGVALPPRRDRPGGCRTIFVGGLPPGIGLETINEIFQRFGEIDDVKLHKQGVCHIRFVKQEMVEQSFFLSGYRFKSHDQTDNEATTLFIDYALNRDDQAELERKKREPTPPRVEPFSPSNLTTIVDKIKSDTDFAEAAPTLANWLEKGECNKKNANTFYTMIQACNNQMRRLHTEKMSVDDEFLTFKSTLREKFQHIIFQFEQVAKILTAAKHKRSSDHFSKQQRRNIEFWLKMTEDLDNIKEEFNMLFDDDETEKIGQKLVPADKYEALKAENDSLICQLEGYRNEAHLAKDEAERKFEKFKAHFIAQQALHGGNPPNNQQQQHQQQQRQQQQRQQQQHQQQQNVFPPLPPPPMPVMDSLANRNAPPTPDEMNQIRNKQEAKVVAMLTSFLFSTPQGANLEYLTSYVGSMVPNFTQHMVNQILMKNSDIFMRQNDRWTYVLGHRHKN